MQRFSCDVCGQPATHHETKLDQGVVVEQHYCPDHGQPVWQECLATFKPVMTLSEVKDMLFDRVDCDPAKWVPDHMTKEEVKERISAAATLDELMSVFRPG